MTTTHVYKTANVQMTHTELKNEKTTSKQKTKTKTKQQQKAQINSH